MNPTPHNPLLPRMLATLGLGVGLFAVLLVLLALSLIKHNEQLALDNGRKAVERVVEVTEASVNRSLVSVDMMLAETADWLRGWPEQPDTTRVQNLQRLLKAALNQNLLLRDVVVLDTKGQVLASAKPNTPRLGFKLPEGFLAEVVAQSYPSLQMGVSQMGMASPERSLFFARSVGLDGQRKAIAVAEVHLPLIASLIDPGDPSNHMWATLERDNGQLLASHPVTDALTGQVLSPPLTSAMANGQALPSTGRLDRQDALMAVRPTLYAGVLISAGMPRSAVLAAWHNERQVIVGVTLVLLLLVLITAGLLWFYLVRLATARAQVAQSLSLVEATLEATADALLVAGLDGEIKRHNQQFLLTMGVDAESWEAIQAQRLNLIRDWIAPRVANPTEFLRTTHEAYEHPTQETRDQIELTDGRVFVRHSLPQWLNGVPVGRVWNFQDITPYKRAEASLLAQQKALNLAHADLAATLEAIPDLLFELDEEGRYVDCRAGHQGLLAAPVKEMLGRTVHEVLPTQAAQAVTAALVEAKASGHSFGKQMALDLAHGKAWFELSVACKTGPQGEHSRFIVISRDITARKQQEDLIWQQAHYDPLTGLPNRRMFKDQLAQCMQQAQAQNGHLALLFMDLDRFKEINDTHGHDMGDLLLQTAAQRLQSLVQTPDLAARMGGDEFMVLIAGTQVAERAAELSAALLEQMGAPFHLGLEQDYVTASIGITLYPEDAQDAETLIKQADQAMYAAKRLGRNRFERFTAAMQEAVQTRSRLARDLRNALAQQQLWLAYQPLVDLRTGRIEKAEALIRWQHPQQGAISPAQFIPIAEETGLIMEIGQWVFETAAQQLSHWRSPERPGFQISINTSPIQYQRQGLQAADLQAHLNTRGLDGGGLVLEITEGLLMDASDSTRQHLRGLHQAGFGLALDDFGTGYSAMSYLHQFDLDCLKIDQSFVRGLKPGSKDLALCKATIVMAHELGLTVVAEGIETAEQRDLLTAAGCDFGQGYLFSRPVSAHDFAALLAEQTPKS